MIEVVIIGSGNVATHLYNAFLNASDVKVIQVFARTQSLAIPLELQTSNWEDLKEASIYVISVSDDAIEEVASQIPYKNKLVVHTSGTTSIEVLPFEKRGVFYPLQTFSKDKSIDFSIIPVCVEASNEKERLLLFQLASYISSKVYTVSSEQRKALHVAAVFVCNFTNHLYQIGASICETNKVSFEVLIPLIEETAKKIEYLTPKQAQTGPALRGDIKTIESHLNFLSHSEYKEVYQTITQSIQNNVKKL